jgi:hypothetical protein
LYSNKHIAPGSRDKKNRSSFEEIINVSEQLKFNILD